MQERIREVENLPHDKLTIAEAVPLLEVPKDIRAKHCETARDLDLFLFSSDYQGYRGGSKDLQTETGLDVGLVDGFDIVSLD